MNRFVLSIFALVAAFASGYVPQHDKVIELEGELALVKSAAQSGRSHLELQRDLLALQSHIGMALVDVEEKNYGQAHQRTDIFFADVCRVQAKTANDRANRSLGEICSRRDEILSDLTSIRSEVAGKLRQMYVRFPTTAHWVSPSADTSGASEL